jgi:hypothetical protein
MMRSDEVYAHVLDAVRDLLEAVDCEWNTVPSTRNLLTCERAPDDPPGDGLTIHFDDGGSIRVNVLYDTDGGLI